MHPAIGAGVVDHSAFFREPWDRVIRSVPQILGVVYNPDPEKLGHRVRDYHRRITGVDHLGRPYRALDPDTFWWAHATFQNAVEQVIDRFDARRLGDPEREELYLDGVEWYRRYGVSMGPVPTDHAAFRQAWRRHCDEVLELTPAAARVIDIVLHDRSINAPFLPQWLGALRPVIATRLLRLTAIGGLPDPLRRRFSIPWGTDKEIQYRLVQVAVRGAWRYLPERMRFGPTAAAGLNAARRE
jgi:uncharacterized protein (DUF2236 family)